jgi:membrane fusion protein (multidrug efflux system)
MTGTQHRSLLAVLLLACSTPGEQVAPMPELSEPEDPGARVEIARLNPSGLQLDLELPGEVSGFRDVLLASPMGGLVKAVHVDLGDAVSENEVVVAVDHGALSAQLLQAEAQLALAQAELARTTQMGDLAVGAETDARKAQVAIAEAGVQLVKSQLAHAVVRSPIAGVVVGRNIDPGEFAAPGTPLLRVVQLDPVKISISVSDRDVVALQPGLPAQVTTAALGDLRMGTVRSIGQAADLSTRSFLVEVEVPNPDKKLLPGMIAKVKVGRGLGEGALVIPQDWLVTRLDGYGVFVAEGETARWRQVTLGDIVRGQVVVQSGLQSGDRVVMTGQHDLVEGDKLLVSREGTCCADGRAQF